MDSIHQARLAQSVEHLTWNQRFVGSSPTVERKFSFCILSFPTRSWQVDWFHANEIKHDVHPRYIGKLFKGVRTSFKLYALSSVILTSDPQCL